MRPVVVDEWKNLYNCITLIERSKPFTTRASIAKQLALSRTTVSLLVSKLIAFDLIEELDYAVSGRGRPGIPLKLSDSTWYALGASYQQNDWHFLLVNLHGEIIVEHHEYVPSSNVEQCMEKLIAGLNHMIGACPGKLLPLLGIGTPGLVNSETGVIIRADDMGWKDVHVSERIHKETGYHSLVINRHRAAGLAEVRFGAGMNIQHLIYIGIGSGISAAFINDMQLLEGVSYSAGEIGHMVINPNGPLCGCGRYGCLQAYSSSLALVRLVKERHASAIAMENSMPRNVLWDMLHSNTLTGEIVGIEANNGNPIAIECLKKITVPLGIAVANLITALNPKKVIIGGTLGNTGPLLTRLIAEEASKRAMSYPFASVTIEQSSLGNKAGALGAASLALQHKVELVVQKHS